MNRLGLSQIACAAHYMAFAKTQKRISDGVFFIYFKIGLNLSSFQKLQNLEFLPNDTFLTELRIATNPGLWRNFQSP